MPVIITMEHLVEIPVFPLAVLPLPNELMPLHIFEPRYRQMLKDVEEREVNFGIYYSHGLNTDRIGGLMKLESVLKRYHTGESDIVAKCIDIFLLTKFYQQWKPKLYPGGKVYMLNVTEGQAMTQSFIQEFRDYMKLRKVSEVGNDFDIHDVANELNLDNGDRLKYLKLLSNQKREIFLKERLKYQKFILEQELRNRDNFFMN